MVFELCYKSIVIEVIVKIFRNIFFADWKTNGYFSARATRQLLFGPVCLRSVCDKLEDNLITSRVRVQTCVNA